MAPVARRQQGQAKLAFTEPKTKLLERTINNSSILAGLHQELPDNQLGESRQFPANFFIESYIKNTVNYKWCQYHL